MGDGRTLEQLEVALSLTDCVQSAYVNAEPQTRRLFNQAIFARIWIKQEAVSDIELASPFGDLLADDLLDDIAQITSIAFDDAPGGGSDPQNAETLTALLDREGSNVQRMVRQRGLEPPRP